MQRTIRVRLKPTAEQRRLLVETLATSTACFNAVASYGWRHGERNGVKLHKATYYPLRAEHPSLPAQLVVSARTRATESVASALTRARHGRRTGCPTSSLVPIRYDARSYRLLGQTASLATVSGRQVVPFATNPHAAGLLAQATGIDSADLIRKGGKFWLHVALTLPDVPFSDTGATIGVDLGLTRPAVTSEAHFLGQRRWRDIDRRYFRLKRSLQAKGTPSARRHLRKLAGKAARFRRDCDHILSKRIVQLVNPGTTIVVENLTEIRTRVKQRGRASRRRLHAWSFAQLRAYLTYKAEAAGCRVVGVDPRLTSQRCNACGHIERGNRDVARFMCRQCSARCNADLNAARNIRDRHLVGWGSAPAGGLFVKQPIAGDAGVLHQSSACKPPALAGGT